MDLLECILFQMLFMSHERFSPDQLAQSSRGYVYFEPDGASIDPSFLFYIVYHRWNRADADTSII